MSSNSCPQQTFNAVTLAVWTCLVTQAAAHGVTVGGWNGTVSHKGYTITYSYDTVSEILTIQCTQYPSGATCSEISNVAQYFVQSCMPS